NPNVPGSLLDIIELQAGTVIAGIQLSSLPHTPSSITRLKFGNSSRHCSKTSSGGAQSSPMTRTLFRRLIHNSFFAGPFPARNPSRSPSYQVDCLSCILFLSQYRDFIFTFTIRQTREPATIYINILDIHRLLHIPQDF